MRQRPEEPEVVEIEIVAGVDAEAERVRELGGRGIAREARAAGGLARRERARERLGVELDAIGAQPRRPADRRRLGIDEHADANARVAAARRSTPLKCASARVRPASRPGS